MLFNTYIPEVYVYYSVKLFLVVQMEAKLSNKIDIVLYIFLSVFDSHYLNKCEKYQSAGNEQAWSVRERTQKGGNLIPTEIHQKWIEAFMCNMELDASWDKLHLVVYTAQFHINLSFQSDDYYTFIDNKFNQS